MEYDFITIIKLIIFTLLPVAVSIALYLFEKRTKFGKIAYWKKQTVIGVLFGGLAVLATVFGIPVEGAVLNVRNATPLIAGLLFGGPSGIIAGVIGGTYRFFATYWGAGEFTQVACSISCVLAGLFSAGCRKFMFDNKKPSWSYGLIIGATSEVLHMLLIFITNLDDIYKAYNVVAICSQPMISCNAFSVTLSLLVIAVIGKDRKPNTEKRRQISQIFQFLLMICITLAFAATMFFTVLLQNKIAYANADGLLSLSLDDVKKDVSDAVNSGGDVTEEIRRAVNNRHIGQKGGIVVVNDSGVIIFDNGGIHEGEPIASFKDNGSYQPRVRFKTKIGDDDYLCMYDIEEGYCLIANIPVSEALFSRNIAVYILAFMEVIVFSALFIHVYFLLKKIIVDNIHKINCSLGQITRGDLSVYVDVRGNEEFASLSNDINATVETLKRYIAEAESRIDRELEFARQIQHSALPNVFPPFPDRNDFEIYASMDPAKEVGGDFYDFYLTDKDHLSFLVADVSGKGIPASLFMMRAKTLIKSLVESGREINEAMTEANRVLSENNEAEMFVTCWLGKLDLVSGTLEYVNAGHNPPLYKKAGEKFEFLRSRPDFILAGMSETEYKKHIVELGDGDEIFVYTDGVTEATDANKRLYGEKRLSDILCEADDDPYEICLKIKNDIGKFENGAEQSDDITMLCVKFKGKSKRETISVDIDASSIGKINDFVSHTLDKWEVAKKISNKSLTITDEVFSNIARYSEAKSAEVSIFLSERSLTFVFTDDGKKYNPLNTKEPDVTLSAEERQIGGLGIHLVRKLASNVNYEFINGKNILTVRLGL